MPIKDSLLAWIRRVLRSPFGWLLVSIHFGLLVYDFALQDPIPNGANFVIFFPGAGANVIAGRVIHWYYESALLKMILLIDLPGIFVTVFLWFPIEFIYQQFFPHFSLYIESWTIAIILLTGTSIQWLLIGYCVESVVLIFWRTRNSQLPP